MSAELVNGERLAHNVNSAKVIQKYAQTRRLDAVDFEVPVLRLLAHQLVAHAAANQERASACVAHCLREIENCLRNIHD